MIGCGTYISISLLKKIIKQLMASKYLYNENEVQKKFEEKIKQAYNVPNFDKNVADIITKSYDPEIKIFENVTEFFAFLIRYTRLTEYLCYILVSKLLHHLSLIKSPGLISNLIYQIKKWITCHYVFAFNGANFDNILIENELSSKLLSKYGSKIKINKLCGGQSCINLSYSVSKQLYTNSLNEINISKSPCEFKKRSIITFRDTRKIVPQGSLNQLANVYDVPVNKLLFPYSFLKNKEFLLSITCDNILQYSYLFYDVLKFKTMSDENQKLFFNNFKYSMCCNLFQYLKVYLNRDVLVLHNLMNKIIDAFEELINCNIILQKKLTISNLAYSNIYISYNIDNVNHEVLQISSSKFINNVIKNSVIGGYCCSNVTNTDINSNFIINENLLFDPNLSANVWHKAPNQPFNQPSKKLLSYDIR